MISNTCSTIFGASPSDGSSNIISFGLRHERAADRQHLLLAAGERARHLAAPLRQPRKLRRRSGRDRRRPGRCRVRR